MSSLSFENGVIKLDSVGYSNISSQFRSVYNNYSRYIYEFSKYISEEFFQSITREEIYEIFKCGKDHYFCSEVPSFSGLKLSKVSFDLILDELFRSGDLTGPILSSDGSSLALFPLWHENEQSFEIEFSGAYFTFDGESKLINIHISICERAVPTAHEDFLFDSFIKILDSHTWRHGENGYLRSWHGNINRESGSRKTKITHSWGYLDQIK